MGLKILPKKEINKLLLNSSFDERKIQHYHYYFNGYGGLTSSKEKDPLFPVELPGLPPLQIRDLPSFLTTTNSDGNPSSFLFSLFQEVFQIINKEISSGSKPKVLVNTFHELEAGVISSVDDVDMITVGPLVPSGLIDSEDSMGNAAAGGDLFKHDSKGYMEWLDSKKERSVVYVSFGSLSVLSKRQLEEILQGLEENGAPYLWVVRKDIREKGGGIELEGKGEGMVVEWCSQVRVLAHRSIGCFVTHCGWNSTVESMVSGVPTVMLPQWTDQATNAKLAEDVWGTGVRAEVNREGLVEGRELRRCLDLLIGEGERAVEIRRRAEMWKEKARVVVGEGGSSVRNIRAFVEGIFLGMSSPKS